MKIRFRALHGSAGATPRPVLDVGIEGLEETRLGCLVDTGSLHNRFGVWVAQVTGIDISAAPQESIGIGGRHTIARTVPVQLAIGEHIWRAPVSFCDPWPWDFNLLGQEGFLRWFKVTIEAARRSIEIVPQR